MKNILRSIPVIDQGRRGERRMGIKGSGYIHKTRVVPVTTGCNKPESMIRSICT